MSELYLVQTPADFEIPITHILQQHAQTEFSTLILALRGDLGAGKTTFTQQLGKILGVSEPITSPTFTIMKQYDTNHDYFDRVIHLDSYRFESADEVIPLHLAELCALPRTVVCIEWPERIENYIPAQAVQVAIHIIEGETRQVAVTYPLIGSSLS